METKLLKASKKKVCVLIAFKNESRYLHGFFNHLEGYVDGFIAVDDHSSDDSYQIAAKNPKVVAIGSRTLDHPAHAKEAENRYWMLRQAYQHKYDWCLCLDADERCETKFLLDLPHLVSRYSGKVMWLHVRDLWGSPTQYRIDPPWCNKVRPCLIPCCEPREYWKSGLHSRWTPPHLDDQPRQVILNSNLYHLRSLHASDRAKRVAKFKEIDPHGSNSGYGYEYLADETGLVTETIPAGQEYLPQI